MTPNEVTRLHIPWVCLYCITYKRLNAHVILWYLYTSWSKITTCNPRTLRNFSVIFLIECFQISVNIRISFSLRTEMTTLSQWSMNKMADILQTAFQMHFLHRKGMYFLFKFRWNSFVQVKFRVSQYWFGLWLDAFTGDKPLLEPMLIKLYDAT